MFTLRVVLLVALVGAGAEVSDIRQVSRSGAGAYEASMARRSDGFAIAWYDTRNGRPELFARLVSESGVPSGPELRLTRRGVAYEPDIAVTGADLVAGWYESDATSTFRAVLGRWTGNGRRLWSRQLSTPKRPARNPVVRVEGQRIFAAWLESVSAAGDAHVEVRAQWFDLSGRPVGPAQNLAPAGKTTWNLNAAIDRSGRAWVVFDAHAGTQADELFVSIVGETTSETRRFTSDDGKASKYPDLAFSAHGEVALTWFDERDGNQEVYLVVVPSLTLREVGDDRARRVTNTPGESIGAYVAWNGDRVGLAWCDNTLGQHEVYFESFDSQGRPLESGRRITDNVTDSLIPSIHAAGDGFALVWNEVTPGPAGGHDPRSRSEIAFTRAGRSQN